MNSFRLNNLSLKYKMFKPLGYKDIGIRNLGLWQRINSFEIKIVKQRQYDYLILENRILSYLYSHLPHVPHPCMGCIHP